MMSNNNNTVNNSNKGQQQSTLSASCGRNVLCNWWRSVHSAQGFKRPQGWRGEGVTGWRVAVCYVQKLILVEHSKLKFKILFISLSLSVLIKRISDADKNFVDYHSPRCGKLLILMALKEVMTAIDRKGERGRERKQECKSDR